MVGANFMTDVKSSNLESDLLAWVRSHAWCDLGDAFRAGWNAALSRESAKAVMLPRHQFKCVRAKEYADGAMQASFSVPADFPLQVGALYEIRGEDETKEQLYRAVLVDIRHRLRSDPADFETAVGDLRSVYDAANSVLMDNGDGFASPEEPKDDLPISWGPRTAAAFSAKEPAAECDHPRSELLARKGDQFEMRKCLDCTKIFRVRLPEKASEHRTLSHETISGLPGDPVYK
jgi:hypothetical protein